MWKKIVATVIAGCLVALIFVGGFLGVDSFIEKVSRKASSLMNETIDEAIEAVKQKEDEKLQLYEPYIDLYLDYQKGNKSTIADLENYNKWFWGEKEKGSHWQTV